MKAKIINISSDKFYHYSFQESSGFIKNVIGSDHKFIALSEIRLCGKWLNDMF